MIKTREQYLESLRDGRELYYNGKRVNDVTTFPPLKWSLETFASLYDLKQRFPDLLTFKTETGDIWDKALKIPTSYEDIVRLRELYEFYYSYLGEGMSRITPITMIYLANELMFRSKFSELNPAYGKNVESVWRNVAEKDLILCGAFPDPRGDRSTQIYEQDDPDLTLRMVEKRSDGIIVRGAKTIATASPFCNELFVTSFSRFPMEKYGPYALLFVVPMNTKGIKLVVRDALTDEAKDTPWALSQDEFDAFVIFDDVFVPNDRIFYAGEWKFADWMQLQYPSWASWFYTVQAMLRAELMVGCAKLVSQFTGTANFPTVKEKITEMLSYCEALRCFIRTSEFEYEKKGDGVVQPKTSTSLTGQWFANQNYSAFSRTMKDLAGALVVTTPSKRTLDQSPELKRFFDKYFGYKKDLSTADEKLALYRLIRDLTYTSLGGRLEYLVMYFNGTNTLQKMLTYEYYDGFERCILRAKRASGIDSKAEPWKLPTSSDNFVKKS
jgi:aromatic ring hydroxylase